MESKFNSGDYSKLLKDPRWQKKRLEILSRDKFMCQFCYDEESPLHVHHIAYFNGFPWEIPNHLLKTLCEDCHENETIKLKSATYKLIQTLKKAGFTAGAFDILSDSIEKSKINWDSELNCEALKLFLTDKEAFNIIYDMFLYGLKKRHG